MKVYPTTDAALIDRILTAPEIADKVSHDGRSSGYIDHPAVTYWAAEVCGEIVGIFTAIRFSTWEREVHVGILRPGLSRARELSLLFLGHLFSDPQTMRATAYVLGTLPTAANFCRKLGFKDEGRRRDACAVAGNPCDIIILGMTRADRNQALAPSRGVL